MAETSKDLATEWDGDLTQVPGYSPDNMRTSERCGDGACAALGEVATDLSGRRQFALASTLENPNHGVVVDEDALRGFFASVQAGEFDLPA